jgi:hypothetical protein
MFWRDAVETSIQELWFREPLQSCDGVPVEAMSELEASVLRRRDDALNKRVFAQAISNQVRRGSR